MNKQSYILLTHIFQVRASYLRSLSFRPSTRATDTRLREESHARLMSELRLQRGESHARLMSELRLQRGVWIHTATAVCAPRSRAAEGTRRAARRGRAARGGRRYPDAPAAVTRSQSLRQPQTPQSARIERAVRQVPSRSSAAVEAGVSSPVYMPWMQHHPVLGRETALRMPGAWEDAERQVGGGGLRGYGYGSAGVSSDSWGSEPPRGEGQAGFYFKVVVMLLVVVAVLWWM